MSGEVRNGFLYPDKLVQRLGNLHQLLVIDNINIIFWGVGNILAVDMVCEPLR